MTSFNPPMNIIFSDEERKRGARQVSVYTLQDGSESLCCNCYSYGFRCENCKVGGNFKYAVMTWDQFKKKCCQTYLKNSCSDIPESYKEYCEMQEECNSNN